MTGPKIVTVDLETFPAEAYVWRLFDETIPLARLITPGGILGVGYKWHHEKATHWVDMRSGDMAQFTWDLLDEADIVVGFNSNRFDVKHINTLFALERLGPTSPYKSVDLYASAVKAKFKFDSGKLEHVAARMGVGRKADAGGMETWIGCMKGDEKCWRRMAFYCRQDVRITAGLYDEWLPWISNHPNVNVYTDGQADACTKCGSVDLERRGFAYTAVQVYQQYRCRACKAWSRGVSVEGRAGGTRAS